jgi:hypothetical protein
MPAPAAQPTLPADQPGFQLWLVLPAALSALGVAALGLLFWRRRRRPISPSRD